MSFEQAACVGVNFVTAWKGLVEGADLRSGETVLIIAASGGVGNAAVQIARRLGAKVIGSDRKAPRSGAAIATFGLSLVADGTDLPAAVRDATMGRGVDVVLDCVGGVMFRHALDCLALNGRLVEMSATGTREVTFDLADFYHNESRLIGIDTLKLDLAASAQVLQVLAPGFEAGDYRPAPITRRFPLHQAAAAYDGRHGRGTGADCVVPARVKSRAPRSAGPAPVGKPMKGNRSTDHQIRARTGAGFGGASKIAHS